MKFEPGDLVQLRKGVTGQGEVGVLLGPVSCHPTNLRVPDGRLKPRR
jgi:hypothetical protein